MTQLSTLLLTGVVCSMAHPTQTGIAVKSSMRVPPMVSKESARCRFCAVHDILAAGYFITPKFFKT